MASKSKAYHDGECVKNFAHAGFIRDLRVAKLLSFPEQHLLGSTLDEVLWLLWVILQEFDHHSPIYAEEIAELAEIRCISLGISQIEMALERAERKVLRKQYELEDEDSDKIAYKITEKGINYLKENYAETGPMVFRFDGSKPWTDRNVALPEIATQFKGDIQIVDKYYGRASLTILSHFSHCTKIQFLTGKTSELNFDQELSNYRKEYPQLEIRLFHEHRELHDRYIISDDALLIVGHGIKDLGSKESFMILFKDEVAGDMRSMLRNQFTLRWQKSIPIG